MVARTFSNDFNFEVCPHAVQVGSRSSSQALSTERCLASRLGRNHEARARCNRLAQALLGLLGISRPDMSSVRMACQRLIF